MNREQRKKLLEQKMYDTAKQKGHSIISTKDKYYVFYDDKEWEKNPIPDEYDNPKQYLKKWYWSKHNKNKK